MTSKSSGGVSTFSSSRAHESYEYTGCTAVHTEHYIILLDWWPSCLFEHGFVLRTRSCWVLFGSTPPSFSFYLAGLQMSALGGHQSYVYGVPWRFDASSWFQVAIFWTNLKLLSDRYWMPRFVGCKAVQAIWHAPSTWGLTVLVGGFSCVSFSFVSTFLGMIPVDHLFQVAFQRPCQVVLVCSL